MPGCQVPGVVDYDPPLDHGLNGEIAAASSDDDVEGGRPGITLAAKTDGLHAEVDGARWINDRAAAAGPAQNRSAAHLEQPVARDAGVAGGGVELEDLGKVAGVGDFDAGPSPRLIARAWGFARIRVCVGKGPVDNLVDELDVEIAAAHVDEADLERVG